MGQYLVWTTLQLLILLLATFANSESLDFKTEGELPTASRSAFNTFKLRELGSTKSHRSYQSNSGERHIVFENIEFGAFGAKSVSLKFNNLNEFGGSLEIRVDSENGPILGSVDLSSRQTASEKQTFELPISANVDGTRLLILNMSPNLVADDIEFQFYESGPRSGAFYAFMSVMHGKVVSAEPYARDGSRIVMLPFRNVSNQLFEFVEISSEPGNYKLLIKDSKKALSLSHNSGVRDMIIMMDYRGLRTQQWRIQKARIGFYLIERNSGKCMEVVNGNESDNVNVFQNSCQDYKDNNQKWFFMSYRC